MSNSKNKKSKETISVTAGKRYIITLDRCCHHPFGTNVILHDIYERVSGKPE